MLKVAWKEYDELNKEYLTHESAHSQPCQIKTQIGEMNTETEKREPSPYMQSKKK